MKQVEFAPWNPLSTRAQDSRGGQAVSYIFLRIQRNIQARGGMPAETMAVIGGHEKNWKRSTGKSGRDARPILSSVPRIQTL